ncbi:hypothetical protein HCN_1512 [Helicobacter cinaedi PAGU611]|uniref:Lipoprotein n=1 Tax=Helicobacter cinaedi CCUG 18818 = ATCC BAA-847 TaxID=537971 RepID=A0AAI8MK19_9HELI|nr:hypothetical protein [Helicobacter cinaedi]EFR45583.1 hypothetical protein HCCG_00129 [Helicobacter cinaedi CCUG 18818 = ATCC BAA-847]QOQ91112.1 hypothetical protein HW260_01780 [Helicobacter cinaedi]BAM12710.1 hypothetical protein HCN_1512 [Helicobacter cinaedi PAGU611]BAM32957.1 hypothetical protein HCBAA847_1728 [Helicobacter cinaedi CCUG 18818 = ATCC BAA-847]BBB20524.1 hypothetical protein HC081234_17010 [Helicobacter cinaedi]
MKKLALVLVLGLIFAACSDNTKEKKASAPAPVIEDKPVQDPTQVTVVPADENNADIKPEVEAPATSEYQVKPDEQKEEKAQ